MVMTFRVAWNVGNFLTSWSVRFSERRCSIEWFSCLDYIKNTVHINYLHNFTLELKLYEKAHTVFASSARGTVKSFAECMVDGNVPCSSLQWICVCECMEHWLCLHEPAAVDTVIAVVCQNKIRYTDPKMCQSSLLQDASIETISTCSVQVVYVDWKHFAQEKCRAFTCLIKMQNAYMMSLSGVCVSYCLCHQELDVHAEPRFNLCEV
jgi:hypothetical protein